MVINIFLFLGIVFLVTFLLGRLIEKIKVPWIFAALILGAILAIHNPFSQITSSPTFTFLGQLGMYFLLFVIGFELDLKKLRKMGKFIVRATFFIILFEAFFGALLIHFVFSYNWFISCIVAISFATVGEAILIPILDKFKIINTKLGQSLIGIGTLDDIIEIIVLILAVFLIGSMSVSSSSHILPFNVLLILVSLFVLFAAAFILTKLKKESKKFSFLSIETLFPFVLFILFLFLGIGKYAEAGAIAALLAGMSLKTFLPKKRSEMIKNEIKIICYGFFAPLFFLWVGVSMNINYLVSYPLLILLVVAVSKSAKLLGSYIVGKRELGTKNSILLGIGLSVRFSTSIIIIKILFDSGLVHSGLYSIIVASSIVFKFIVPVLFSNLLVRWGRGKKKNMTKKKF